MERHDVAELHFITPVANLASIGRTGIRCNRAMENVPHASVAEQGVQDRRAVRTIPGGMRLHSYTNLYFDARNSMMYVVRRVRKMRDIAVVRVAPEVLDLPGVVVSDGNSASSTTQFFDPATELEMLDKERIFAVSWNSTDEFQKAEWKRQRSAEVLVPDVVAPEMLRGLYVETQKQADACRQAVPHLPVEVKPDVFFC